MWKTKIQLTASRTFFPQQSVEEKGFIHNGKSAFVE